MLDALRKTPERLSQACLFLFERSRPQRVVSDQQVEIGLEAEVYRSAHALWLPGYLGSISAGLTAYAHRCGRTVAFANRQLVSCVSHRRGMIP